MNEQRWNRRRSFLIKPSAERFDPRKHEVQVIDRPSSKGFIETHHYSGTYTTNRLNVGLFRVGVGLVGVCVFGNPTSARAVGAYFRHKYGGELHHTDVVGLTRFVLLDEVEWTGESWFLARARELLRKHKPGVRGILSYSDPVPRRTLAGDIVMPGHVGTIYQATNGIYVGRSKRDTKHINQAGCIVNRRMTGKIRNEQRGHQEAYRLFLELGAPKRKRFEDPKAYVARALSEGPFTTMTHPGNHVYVWTLDKRVQSKKDALPYPKQIDRMEVT